VLPFLILSPFVAAPLAAWIVKRRPGGAVLLAVWPAVLSATFAQAFRATTPGTPRLVELPWAPSLGLSLTFNLDGLGLLFALLITGVGTLVVVYGAGYLHGHAHAGRFHAWLFAFMGAMLGVVLSDNLFTLFVFWELTGFTSFVLIGFDFERAHARAAAIQALVVTGAGGLALLAAAILLHQVTGSVSLSAIAAAGGVRPHPFYVAITTLVLLAAFTKSAQVPFHFWLPNAMAAPTPVSAYLHSATMVKAGVYLAARMTPILGGTSLWMIAVGAAGAGTMVLGSWRAVQETDLKRILAYSTISALGVLMLLLALGTGEAVVAALVYLLAHACYKGALFLVSGALEHETGSRDVTALGGLRRTMPFSAAAAALAALSMAGVPLFLGFLGKEAFYDAALHAGAWSTILLVLAVGASVLLGVAGLVAGVSPFAGQRGKATAAHDAPPALWMPPMILALAGLLGGMIPAALSGPLGSAATSIMREPVGVSLSLWHGLTPVFLLSALTLAATAALYPLRRVLGHRTFPRWLGTERLYAGTLDLLDAVSRAIAPPLRSASLRSYVMAIVLTGGVFIAAAFVTGGSTRSFRLATDVRVHEVILVLVIVAAAISAAVATSSMAAVLALGTVGYGVALMFVSFGAPDLAMTQFSVETLTVVIFVLVFRHFPRFGAVSPGIVRTRDALVSGAVGTLIAVLVLFVGTSGVPSRLAGYFVENGPTLAHGRNIVNVILVDFRAFDTLGEITVLVTAAIGVAALLRIASDRPAASNGSRADRRSPSSSILRTATRVLMPLLLLFAVFLLLRGHNEPGGGFVGGLVVAAAFALHAIAYGVVAARRALVVQSSTLLGVGLLLALSSGLLAWLNGDPLLTAQWITFGAALGTPLLFDIGVFLLVIGVVLTMTFTLAEET
jgi:multicomponent Na+:H+ antiporter subunit A